VEETAEDCQSLCPIQAIGDEILKDQIIAFVTLEGVSAVQPWNYQATKVTVLAVPVN
jgi:hypothetical protein